MVSALLVCSALLAVSEVQADQDTRASYETAAARTGRDPKSHVKLALWCEQHGLSAERVKHLALAALIDPSDSAARGLMGLVAYRGRWKSPLAVAEGVKDDEKLVQTLAEYNARRDRADANADDQWKLALWCEQNGLTAEAKAHLAAVVRLDPSRESAWKRLGFKRVGGRWMTPAQLDAEKAEAQLQKQADRQWKPLLKKWRDRLDDKSEAQRQEAEVALTGVTDARAVPSIWAVFVAPGPAKHARAVQLFGQIDSASSSRALAALAVFDDDAEVRRRATEVLRRRDPREFARLLVDLIRDPVKYEVRPVGGPGSPGAIFVEGRRANVQRVYAPPAVPDLVRFGDWVDFDGNGMPYIMRFNPWAGQSYEIPSDPLAHMNVSQFRNYHPTDPVIASAVAGYRAQHPDLGPVLQGLGPNNRRLRGANPALADQIQGFNVVNAVTVTLGNNYIPLGQVVLEHQKAALSAQQQLERDAAAIDEQNAATRRLNDRVTAVLRQVAGSDPGDGAKAWQSWWVDVQGYTFIKATYETPRPTLVEYVPLDYLPAPVPVITGMSTRSSTEVRPFSNIASCFGAGTLVQTLQGARAIETLKVGDRILTQSVSTGALGYQPVTAIHHNPPSPTFLVKVKGDTIVSSPFHRFWAVGKGWVMARDLKGGEKLRLLSGPATVESVTGGTVQRVFNLDIDEDHDFFAGAAAALVHDNTLPDPRLVPFDAATDVASAAREVVSVP